jgi:hypothetical protein
MLAGITMRQALFAIEQLGRALRGEALLWGDWSWQD